MKGKISKSMLLQLVLIVALLAADTALHVVMLRSVSAQPVDLATAPLAADRSTAALTEPAPAEELITTYLYRLDDEGQAVWYAVGAIPAGALVKRGPCQSDGYAQVEYVDPDQPGYWRVEHMRCKP
jgi:hypothetical protein